jgi:fibro-slime domain-containing protein
MVDGGNVDPCAAAGLPPDCETEVAPACGDGMMNQATEECDDGNALPGDCCSGNCKVEAYCVCPPDGSGCHSTIVCGDGMRGPGEACDDGNADPGDGCSENCHTVEIGYRCATPGAACIRVYTCGDGIVDPNEGCDDMNIMSGDGCSNHCRIEQGFKCDGMPGPSKCSATTCGDGKKEGAESCDDGNVVAFDGCSADCRAEPACATGMSCTSSCGDGIVFGNEECDDGNSRDGDGCSKECKQEEGYVCNNDAPCTKQMGVDPATGAMADICTLTVPAVFRDFNAHGTTGGHVDFQPGFNSTGAIPGLVQDTLDKDGKPVQSTKATADATGGYMHGQTAFAQWYRDAAPASKPIPGSLLLWDNGKGGYVNRWGAHGERWQGNPQDLVYDPIVYGGPGGTGCEACTPTATGKCYDPCIPWDGSVQACCAEIPASTGYDGNPLFFPIDTAMGILTEARSEGKVPAQYGWNGWPWEHEVATALGVTNVMTATAPFPSTKHNYSFTTEVKYWFKYEATTMATLDFTGDDDVWVFLNGHLAVDLGGWHVPLNGTLTINGATINATTQVTVNDDGTTKTAANKPGTATTYGLTAGNVYQIQIFHAERQVEGSSFKLTLAGFNQQPSDCVTNCGDGMVGPGEECDDGTNRGGYNECAAGCLLGPRCGDMVRQEEYEEECDDGVNDGSYNGCSPDCKYGPHCGDGIANGDEVCDDGAAAGAYGGCTIDCQIGPHCGDGTVAVSIDPATNLPYEQCDDGNDTVHDGCSNCKIDVVPTR